MRLYLLQHHFFKLGVLTLATVNYYFDLINMPESEMKFYIGMLMIFAIGLDIMNVQIIEIQQKFFQTKEKIDTICHQTNRVADHIFGKID